MRRLWLSAFALLAVSACSFRNVSCGAPPEQPQADATAAPSAEQPLGASPSMGISFLGDSLTAGLGLLSQESYPSRIAEMFEAEGYEVHILNAGLSGDTTAGGLRRIDDAITSQTQILVVALGGNDALRGLTPAQTYANLKGIIDAASARSVDVLLVGMEAPPNLGTDYRDAFRGTFQKLSFEYVRSIQFVPFLLEGVAGDPALNQPDGIHPNAEGARRIAANLYPRIRAMVDRAGGGG
jgi:acyl-CoA thioesterase-1